MASRLPAGWQVRPQDQEPPQQVYHQPYSHLPVGPALIAVVTSNDQTPCFAQINPYINNFQHILASGRYSEYVNSADERFIKAQGEKCREESITFINKQYQALQGDKPILTAYAYEIHDLELELMAGDVQEISATSLAAGYLIDNTALGLKRSILGMMKSRATLLQHDVRVREQLLQIEAAINKYVPTILFLQNRFKYNLIAGTQDERLMSDGYHTVIKDLLPLRELKDQKHAELQRYRETRAALEQRLREARAELENRLKDAKGRLQVREPVKTTLK